MTHPSFSVLKEHAARFRVALDACDKSKLPITFHRFPRGSCGDAALLLAKYLQEAGLGSYDYVLGYREDYSHAWLGRDDLVIDITADQFPDMPEPVVVACASEWHATFTTEILYVADYEIYDDNTRFKLRGAYQEVCGFLRR